MPILLSAQQLLIEDQRGESGKAPSGKGGNQDSQACSARSWGGTMVVEALRLGKGLWLVPCRSRFGMQGWVAGCFEPLTH
jgi:hypothetical protein